jgi:hypothetical protein
VTDANSKLVMDSKVVEEFFTGVFAFCALRVKHDSIVQSAQNTKS